MREIELEKTYNVLKNINEVDQLELRVVYTDPLKPIIEAKVYPSKEAYQSVQGHQGDMSSDVAVYLSVFDIIKKRCRHLPPRQKVRQLVIENKPFNK